MDNQKACIHEKRISRLKIVNIDGNIQWYLSSFLSDYMLHLPNEPNSRMYINEALHNNLTYVMFAANLL
jgi:hypothetical protein